MENVDKITKYHANINKRVKLINSHTCKAMEEIKEAIKLANEIEDFGTVVNLQKSLEQMELIKQYL